MIRRALTTAALTYFSRRGFFILTRAQVYRLVNAADCAQRMADELLRRAEAAEAKLEAYERDAMLAIDHEQRVQRARGLA